MISCGVGGWVNNYSIRAPEVRRGIPVFDSETGKTVGVSKEVAR